MDKKENVEELWEKWFALKNKGIIDLNIKNKLVENYYYLIVGIAKKTHEKIKEVTVDELVSMGVPGLYDSISNFNPKKYKNKFQTYASWRIKGSMIDEIRKEDRVPRLVRKRAKEFEQIRSQLESEAKRKLTNAELAERLGKSVEEMEEIIKKSTASSIFNLHEAGYTDPHQEHESGFSYQAVEDEKTIQPLDDMVKKEFFNKLMGKNFSPQERKIIWMIYFEKKTIVEISQLINMSPSGISQKHLSILDKLKQKALKNPSYFKDIEAMIGKTTAKSKSSR